MTPATLPTGHRVTLRLPYVGGLPASIEIAQESLVLLSLMVPDPRVRRMNGADATVENTTARGIQRFGGRLTLLADELVQIEVVGEAERIQRREWARVGVAVPVDVTPVDDKSLTCGRTTSLNLSGGGVLIRDPWSLPLGLDVRIEIVIRPHQPPVEALARVVRDGGPDQKGLQYEDVPPPDVERLMRFVRERERAELRIARGR